MFAAHSSFALPTAGLVPRAPVRALRMRNRPRAVATDAEPPQEASTPDAAAKPTAAPPVAKSSFYVGKGKYIDPEEKLERRVLSGTSRDEYVGGFAGGEVRRSTKKRAAHHGAAPHPPALTPTRAIRIPF
jgi:hypothetical protein